MTLDELGRKYVPGRMIRYKVGRDTEWAYVVGVCWTLRAEPGGPDQPGIVVANRMGAVFGHVLPYQVVEIAPVGTP